MKNYAIMPDIAYNKLIGACCEKLNMGRE